MSDIPDRILAAWNKQDWEEIVALHHEDYVDHLQSSALPPGLDGLKVVFDMFTTAFPDYTLELGPTAASNGKVSYQWLMRATHKGEFMGIPATGNKVEMNAITMLTEIDGKCKEAWGVLDMAGLMQQLAPA
jgi:steroid delta-isomerase-like uncharacterized protein